MQREKLKYGYNYQVKVMTCLLTDSEFASRAYDILSPEYFDSEPLSWLCERIMAYYVQYHTLPTLDTLSVDVQGVDNVVLKSEIITAVENAVAQEDSTDLRFIKDSFLDFCKTQEMKIAIYDSVDLINSGKSELLLSRITSALKKGEDKNVGHNYRSDVDARYGELARTPISTGWQVIDDLTGGGLSKGELGVIIGPGGSGKSWLLTNVCISAVKTGHSVLFITLELKDTYVGVRHDVMLTHMTDVQIKDNNLPLKEQLAELSGELTIKWFPTKALSTVGLRSLLDRMRLLEKMPDMLVLDYADLMRLSSDNKKRKDELLQELYEELRGIAGEYQIPIWTASQTTRDSNKDDVTHIGADMIAESMGKHYTADFMMSLARNSSDKKLNTAKFYVVKNRFGKDGLLLYGKMDTARGKIEIYPNKSNESRTIELVLNDTKVNIGERWNQLMEDDL